MSGKVFYVKNDGGAWPINSGAVNNVYVTGTDYVPLLSVIVPKPGNYLVLAKAELFNLENSPQTASVAIWSGREPGFADPNANPGDTNFLGMAYVGLDAGPPTTPGQFATGQIPPGATALSQQSVFLIGKHKWDDAVDKTNTIYLGAITQQGKALRYSLWVMEVDDVSGNSVNYSGYSTNPGIAPLGYP